MRVLVLISRLPPHGGGGYGFRIRDVVSELEKGGHEPTVLTSTHGLEAPLVEGRVRRVLSHHGETHGVSGILRLARASLADGTTLRRVLAEIDPDVILVANFLGLSSALWNGLRASGKPLVLDVSNGWLVDVLESHGNWFRIWERGSGRSIAGVGKRLVGRMLGAISSSLRTRFPGLGASKVYVTARHLADELEGRFPEAVGEVAVCTSGIDLESFPYRPATRPVRSLLYLGRIKPTKGIHTAIDGVARLGSPYRMTVVGQDDDPAYAEALREQVRATEADVTFRESVPRSEVPEVFAEHDALVFPSEWAEPFSRLILEALACGLPVVSTDRGGTVDAIRDGENGLFFDAGDPGSLARVVARLGEDDALRDRLVETGRRDAEEQYGLGPAVGRIERILLEAAQTR